ncbi:MAG TPA: ATP-binding protein [Candidatus Acidoferrales bacterium]|nr:ATP-binding protein [Candidatus Acidoferrales bacterium]
MPAKQLLKDKDRKFQLLFEEHPQPMWVFDPAGQKVLEANFAAAELFGYSREEFRGMPIQVIRTGGLSYRTGSGRVIEVEADAHAIEYGQRPAELVVLMDVTARQKLEEQLRQAQKMEAVGMLAGGVAHDFNNLLTIINGYSHLILNNLPVSDPNHQSAEQIMKAGERAATLTGQLLAFSRRQVLQPRVLDVNRLIGTLTTMLRRLIGEDIDLQLVLRENLGQVNADPNQLEQVLMNLVVNARDAMPNGGTLTIETTNIDLDENYVHAHVDTKAGRYVLIAVSDTGTGMDDSTKAHAFEPFFTTKGPGRGTGLGLSTVFGIVRQSGGSVDIYSSPGKGTSAKVYLPRVDRSATVETERRRVKALRGSETILVAEDDEMVRSLVKETLVSHGYSVLDASGAEDAQKIAEIYRGDIQLLITDVVMPKVNGRDLAARLMKGRPGLKVLYMSGYTDGAVVNNGILQKEVAFLQKPFTPTALAEKVREVLDGCSGKTHRAAE